MIGLIDLDLQTSTSTTSLIPNLEIMKLAAFYTQEKNIFCRLINLEETELSGYDKIYIFSENQHHSPVPPQFLQCSNVIYGGTGFTNGRYYPFKESLIDYMIGRPIIYKEFLQDKYKNGVKPKIINQVLDNSYYRMYAEKERLPIPPMFPNKKVINYDIDFFYPDWKEIITKLTDRRISTFYRIHPIICNRYSQFFEVRDFNKISREIPIILDTKIPLDEVHYMFKEYEKRFLAEITQTSDVSLPLGNDCKTLAQFRQNLIYSLNLLYSFWSRGIPVKLRYIEPSLGQKNPIEELFKVVETWSKIATASNKKLQTTLEQKVVKTKNGKTKANEQWQELLKQYPNKVHLLKQSWDSLQTGSVWRL